jgi:hypothetical protein
MLKGISEKSGRDIQRKVIKIFLSVSEKFSGIGDGEKAWLNNLTGEPSSREAHSIKPGLLLVPSEVHREYQGKYLSQK